MSMEYKEVFVQALIDRIVGMEPGDQFSFCERYNEENLDDRKQDSCWYGVVCTTLLDLPIVAIAEWGIGGFCAVEQDADDVREKLIACFNNLDLRIYHKVMLEIET